ncbi:hypothetical protein AGMMS50212_07610 [Spirochaetia bacterium]|nr:hypothetical protein AGMMS50212_07610 [Spirochaetia bacterium]
MKPLDYGVFLIAAAVIAASAIFIYGADSGTIFVVSGADGSWLFPADAEETITIAGPLGDTLVHIGNGAASVIASPCQNQNCLAQGSISGGGAWIACLPNRVMVTVEYSGGGKTKGEGDDVDGTTW